MQVVTLRCFNCGAAKKVIVTSFPKFSFDKKTMAQTHCL